MSKMLKGDWHGRYVRLRHKFETLGGAIFPAGTVMKVTRNFGGLHLEAVAVCRRCAQLHRHRIKKIHERDVILLDADYVPDEKAIIERRKGDSKDA